jgi:hypothetical protein
MKIRLYVQTVKTFLIIGFYFADMYNDEKIMKKYLQIWWHFNWFEYNSSYKVQGPNYVVW